MIRYGLLIALAAIGCTKPAPGSNADAAAVDAAENGDATTVDASVPDAAADGQPMACNPDDCPLGCHDTEPRCNDVAPSNGLGPYLDMAAQADDLVLADGTTINTTDGTITDSGGNPILAPSELIPAPENGVAIRVFPVKSLVLGDIAVTGDGDPLSADPPIAFVSDGEITIKGVVVVNPGRLTTADCAGSSPACTEGQFRACAGGAGSGFGSAGGDGGAGENNGNIQPGGNGGSAVGNESLEPLRGGCDAKAQNLPTFPGDSVPAGGAIQLVSVSSIRLVESGWLDLNGRGGRRGIGAQEGGASGGAALLEAPLITLAVGTGITANGGGGAGNCEPGSPGQRSAMPALGGQCAQDGGDGAAGATEATDGQGSSDSMAGGGGGGGYGRIRINTAGQVNTEPGAIISPQPSIGTLATR